MADVPRDTQNILPEIPQDIINEIAKHLNEPHFVKQLIMKFCDDVYKIDRNPKVINWVFADGIVAVEYPKNIWNSTDEIHGHVLKKLEEGNYVGVSFGWKSYTFHSLCCFKFKYCQPNLFQDKIKDFDKTVSLEIIIRKKPHSGRRNKNDYVLYVRQKKLKITISENSSLVPYTNNNSKILRNVNEYQLHAFIHMAVTDRSDILFSNEIDSLCWTVLVLNGILEPKFVT